MGKERGLQGHPLDWRHRCYQLNRKNIRIEFTWFKKYTSAVEFYSVIAPIPSRSPAPRNYFIPKFWVFLFFSKVQISPNLIGMVRILPSAVCCLAILVVFNGVVAVPTSFEVKIFKIKESMRNLLKILKFFRQETLMTIHKIGRRHVPVRVSINRQEKTVTSVPVDNNGRHSIENQQMETFYDFVAVS